MGAATATASDILSYHERTDVVASSARGKDEPITQATWLGAYPTGSILTWAVIGRTGEAETVGALVLGRESTYPVQEVAELDGEIESIEGDLALLVLKTENQYVERQIATRILKAKGADFEGARVRLIIKESEGVISSEIKNISEAEEPHWAKPDEEFREILRQLKAHLSRPKRR